MPWEASTMNPWRMHHLYDCSEEAVLTTSQSELAWQRIKSIKTMAVIRASAYLTAGSTDGPLCHSEIDRRNLQTSTFSSTKMWACWSLTYIILCKRFFFFLSLPFLLSCFIADIMTSFSKHETAWYYALSSCDIAGCWGWETQEISASVCCVWVQERVKRGWGLEGGGIQETVFFCNIRRTSHDFKAICCWCQ